METNNPELTSEKLTHFFTAYLDRIHCAKSHLVERLPELALQAHFKDIKHAINETLEDVQRQLLRMEEIYILMDIKPSLTRCDGFIAMMEDAYDDIHQHNGDTTMRDLAILFYMQNVESIETSAFQVLEITAGKLNNQPVKQLLRENINEAKEDRALFLLIMKKYMAN